MISDLSKTLYAILKQPGLPEPLKNADILFDRPTEPFNPVKTTVDMFLYDIREDVDLRSNEPGIKRQNGQAIINPPPLRIACSYLVTAWPKGGTDLALQEHHLLSQVLRVLSMYHTIPSSFLQGSLAGQEPPLPMVALHPDALKNLSEFWTALGNKMRPSITITATIAMDVFAQETMPLVITGDVSFGERTSQDEEKISPGTREEFFRIGGEVTDAANAPVMNAAVTIVEIGLTAKTGINGRYELGPIKSGTYTIRVQSGTATPQDFNITVPASIGSNYNVKLV